MPPAQNLKVFRKMNAKPLMNPRKPYPVTMLNTAAGCASKNGLTTSQELKTTKGKMKKGT